MGSDRYDRGHGRGSNRFPLAAGDKVTRADDWWRREARREIKGAGCWEGSFPDSMLDLKKQVGLAAMCTGAGRTLQRFSGDFIVRGGWFSEGGGAG
jgi:hypothetical protein